jgi:hypothetical protein
MKMDTSKTDGYGRLKGLLNCRKNRLKGLMRNVKEKCEKLCTSWTEHLSIPGFK